MPEPIRCACPRRDARDCVEVRYGLDLRRLLDPDYQRDPDDEPCDCSCHDSEAGDDWDESDPIDW